MMHRLVMAALALSMSGFVAPLSASDDPPNGFPRIQAAEEEIKEPTWVVATQHANPNAKAPQSKQLRQVVFMGPRCTCFGRFGDAFVERLFPEQTWVQRMQVERGFGFEGILLEEDEAQMEKGLFLIGAPTRLTFWIDSERDEADLLAALRKAGFDLRTWRVQRWVQLGQDL